MLAGVPPSAGQCRFVRVISVLIFPGAPELCWFCVAQERTGHPRSQRSAEQAFTLDVGPGDGRVSPRSGIDLRLPALGADTQAAGHRRAIAERDTWEGVLEQITARNDAEYALVTQ